MDKNKYRANLFTGLLVGTTALGLLLLLLGRTRVEPTQLTLQDFAAKKVVPITASADKANKKGKATLVRERHFANLRTTFEAAGARFQNGMTKLLEGDEKQMTLPISITWRINCGTADRDLVWQDLQAKKATYLMLSVEPLGYIDPAFAGSRQILSVPDFFNERTYTVTVPRSPRFKAAGIFICTDLEHRGQCSGKKPFQRLLHDKDKQDAQVSVADSIYYFSYVVVQDRTLFVPVISKVDTQGPEELLQRLDSVNTDLNQAISANILALQEALKSKALILDEAVPRISMPIAPKECWAGS